MKSLHFQPYNLELEEYEGYLANREYWDDCGFEWSGYHTMDEKLILLAGYVQHGGDLNRVIEKYSENRDKMYTSRIQCAIMLYLYRLISEHLPKEERIKDTSHIRIMFLDRDELVQLLSEELKRRVTYTLVVERPKGNMGNFDVVKSWYVKKADKFDDTVLSKIEQEHKLAHPNEDETTLKQKYERWFSSESLF